MIPLLPSADNSGPLNIGDKKILGIFCQNMDQMGHFCPIFQKSPY